MKKVNHSKEELIEDKEDAFYEIAFFLIPQLTDQEANQVIEKLKEIIIKQEGEILYIEPFRLQALAYPIKKNTEGYFSFIQFRLKKENVNEIENYLLRQPEFLRYLLIRLNPKEDIIVGLEEKKIIPQTKAEGKVKRIKEPETIKISENKEISLEELEKKIEEILKQ